MTYKWRAALIVALGMFMAVLDNTIVSVALPQIRSSFNTDNVTIAWVATGYLLSFAAIIPVTGYLSDRVGTKLVFMTALAVFTIGSGLCALSTTKEMLIAFRVLQGIGGGALLPTAFAIIFRIFPPQERGPASAVLGVPILLAPAFGPTIGGFFTTRFDWHAIFTINLPIGVIAFTLVLLFLNRREDMSAAAGEVAPQAKRFDLLGLVLSMAGVTSLVYGISQAGNNGWSDPTAVRFLIGGGVLLVAFVVTELFVADPVMDVRLFTNYTFAVSNAVGWVLGAFLFGSLYLLPLFFENQFLSGLSPLNTGEIFISQGLAAAVGVVISGRLYNRVGPRALISIGAALMTAATFGLINLTVTTTGLELQPWLIMRGLGLGLANIPLQTLAMSVVSNRQMARASSLVNVTRQVFSALGVSVLFTYLTQQTTSHVSAVTSTFQATQLAAVQQHCAAQFAANPSGIPGCIQAAAQKYVAAHAFTMGMNDTFLVVLIGCAACIVLALVVGRDPAVEAVKKATRRGETIEQRPAVIAK